MNVDITKNLAYPKPCQYSSILEFTCFIFQVIAFCSLVPFRDLPQLYSLVIGRQKEMSWVLPP